MLTYVSPDLVDTIYTSEYNNDDEQKTFDRYLPFNQL